jgi:hypothetical protein
MNENETIEEKTGTELFIKLLSDLKEGDLGILRSHAGLDLDESLQGFDMFTGIWWPLRQKGWAPKRRVSWLITKLYGQYPFIHQRGYNLAKQLSLCTPNKYDDRIRFQTRFDHILLSQFSQLESHLCWALGTIKKHFAGEIKFDWVQLTNDLSKWDKDDTKNKWAKEFLYNDN